MTPKFFYFDLGNVLLNFSHDVVCEQMGQVAGVPASRVREVLFNTDLNHRFERGDLSREQFYEEFCAATGVRPDLDELERSGADIFTVNLPVLPIVGGLEVAGYQLGILSNTSESHWSHIKNSHRFAIVNKIFKQVVTSFEAKAMKPDAAIFKYATEAAGVAPNEIFFVDDIAGHVAGAKAFGWDAVQFTTAAELMRELHNRGVRINC